jgi:HEAT repeat protein
MRLIGMFGILAAALAGICSGQTSAQATKDESKEEPKIDWPKRIQGKTLEMWVKEMHESPDASTRDQAIRVIPLFGPDCRKAASASLVSAIGTDPDLNVRLTAIANVPNIGFDKEYMDAGLDAMVFILNPANGMSNHMRFETAMALGGSGPIAKRALPTLINYTCVEAKSWENRKAGAFALGRIGLPDSPLGGPDVAAVDRLVTMIQTDKSHQVRHEAVMSLLILGPPHVEGPWRKLRDALQTHAMRDSDKSTALWARVAYIRTEQQEIKANDPNVLAIAKVVADCDKTIRSNRKVIEATSAVIKNQEGLESKPGKIGYDPFMKHEAILTRAEAFQEKVESIQLEEQALQCLGTIGNEASSQLPNLIAIVDDKTQEPIIVIMALWAMSMMPNEIARVLPVVDKLRKHEDEFVKQAATNAYKALTVKADPKNKNDPLKKK